MKNSTLSQSNGDDMDISVRSSDVGSGPDDTGAAVPHSGPSRPGASTTSTPRPSSDVPRPPLGDAKTQVSAASNHRPDEKAQKTSGRGSGRPTRAGARQPHEDDHSLFIAQANSIRGRASRTRSAARDLRPRAQTRTAECGTKDKQEGSSSKSKRSRTTANRPSRSQMAGRRQQLNWQWAQSLIGLQLNVPGYWWPSTPGDKSLHDARITRIDRQDKYGRHFVIHCQDGHDYSMRYDAVREYHCPDQRRIQKFDLPREPVLENEVAQRRQEEERQEPTAAPGNTNSLLVWSSEEDAELSRMVEKYGKSWKTCLDNSTVLREKFHALHDEAGRDRLRKRWPRIATQEETVPRSIQCDPSTEIVTKVEEPHAPVDNNFPPSGLGKETAKHHVSPTKTSLLVAPTVKVERRRQASDSEAKNVSSASRFRSKSLTDSSEKRVPVASKVVTASTLPPPRLEPCKYYDSQWREVEFEDDDIILFAQCDATYRGILCDHFAMFCPSAGTKLSATSADHLQSVAEEAANAIRLKKCGRMFKAVSLTIQGQSCGLCFVQVACMGELVRLIRSDFDQGINNKGSSWIRAGWSYTRHPVKNQSKKPTASIVVSSSAGKRASACNPRNDKPSKKAKSQTNIVALHRPTTKQEATASPSSTAPTNVKLPTPRQPKRESKQFSSAQRGSTVGENHKANVPVPVEPGRSNEVTSSCGTIVKRTARADPGTSRRRVVTPTDQTKAATNNVPRSRDGTAVGRAAPASALRPGRPLADGIPSATEVKDGVSQSPMKRKILTPRKVAGSSSPSSAGAATASPAKAHSPSSVFRRPPPEPEVASGRPRPGDRADLLCSSDDDSDESIAGGPLPDFVMEEEDGLDGPPFVEWMLVDGDGFSCEDGEGFYETPARGRSGVEEEFTSMVLT